MPIGDQKDDEQTYTIRTRRVLLEAVQTGINTQGQVFVVVPTLSF